MAVNKNSVNKISIAIVAFALLLCISQADDDGEAYTQDHYYFNDVRPCSFPFLPGLIHTCKVLTLSMQVTGESVWKIPEYKFFSGKIVFPAFKAKS